MTVIVDSGGANIASVKFALERRGVRSELSADPDVIKAADRVILPGVGMAQTAMRLLEERRLIDCLRTLSQPVLGICLGMQLLFSHSDEGDVDMLDIISGQARHFTPKAGKPIPHMGWNSVSWPKDHPLAYGLDDETYFYFVHSYAIPPGDYTIGVCDYDEAFSAVVAQDNFMGCQFHPERSSEAGAQILKNFLEMKL